jgi:hypothetical protein
MLASDVIALCDTSGIGAVTKMYGISRRQGEQFVIQARRWSLLDTTRSWSQGTPAGP